MSFCVHNVQSAAGSATGVQVCVHVYSACVGVSYCGSVVSRHSRKGHLAKCDKSWPHDAEQISHCDVIFNVMLHICRGSKHLATKVTCKT